MRRLGLLGGMSWVSSLEYERIINTEVGRRLGGNHAADLIIRSYDFDHVEQLQERRDWDTLGALLAGDARILQDAGAEGILLCTNTMHVVADAIEEAISVPFLHIADATAAAVKIEGLTTVGMLGTRYTMEQDFYKGRMEARHGLTVLVPDEPDRSTVHDVIYDELVKGQIESRSRAAFRRIAGRLADRGAEGLIAGCTEVEMLIGPEEVPVPFFPTARLHALAAVDWALAG